MKKYIAAILVPCLLMQFFGCYSSREISLEELQNSDDAIMITKDSTIYYLRKDISLGEILYNSDVYFSNNWTIKQNTEVITLITQKAHKENNREMVSSIKKDTTNINYGDISNVSIESVSTGKTILAVGLTLVGLLGIAFSVFALTFHL